MGKHYPKRPAAIRLANGADYEANVDFHEDLVADDSVEAREAERETRRIARNTTRAANDNVPRGHRSAA